MDAPRDAQPPATRVVIIGGGVAGLIAAISAAEHLGRGAVALVEPHPVGGRARTDRRGGFTFNRGPRALLRGGAADRALAQLGVPVRTGGRPARWRAAAVAGGQARRFALGGGAPLAAARALALVARGAEDDGRSLARWLADQRVAPEVARWVEAMVRVATYAHAPDVLPAGTALAQTRAANLQGVQYLDGGFGALVDSLAARAEHLGVHVVTASVQAVEPRPDGRVDVILTHPGRISADSSVMCTGSPQQTSRLLAIDPATLGRLGPPATVACLELGLRRAPRHRFLLGIDEPTYLSEHGPPAQLAAPGQRVVHVMHYLQPDDDLDSAEVLAGLHATAALAGIDRDDIVEERYLARMTACTSLPLAGAGGLAGRPPVEGTGVPGVFLAGDWVGPTGLLLDAVVASASEAGRRAAARSATMGAR